MSLDIYLELEDAPRVSHIYTRVEGRTISMPLEEWRAQNPDREPIMVEASSGEVYWANITHNLAPMAEEAGLYEALWTPEERGWTHAGQLIEVLQSGLALLESDPARFEKLNPSNGWGTYAGLVEFVKGYLEACKATPEATVRVSR